MYISLRYEKMENIRTIIGSLVTGVLGAAAASDAFDVWLDRSVAIIGIIVGLLTAARLVHQWWLFRKRKNNG